MNELFWENLTKYTYNPFELIIVDNGSDDGSAEFFESVGAKVIRNGANYSYPYCQNRGIDAASYNWLAFLNNDIIVSPNWDKHIIQSMEYNGLEIASACGVEGLESKKETRKYRRRWNKVKLIITMLGKSKFVLSLSHKLMYYDWKKFSKKRSENFKKQIRQGFVGNTIVIKRSAIEKIGLWDERFQAADYDLYFRSLDRAKTIGDIKPVHICLDVYVHHYIRLTVNVKYPPYVDKDNLISVTDRWPISMLDDYDALMAN